MSLQALPKDPFPAAAPPAKDQTTAASAPSQEMSIASSSPHQGLSPVASSSTANTLNSPPTSSPTASAPNPPTPESKALLSTANIPTSKSHLSPSTPSERSPESATRPPLSKVSTSRSVALSTAGAPPPRSNPSSPSSPAAPTAKPESQKLQSEHAPSKGDGPAVATATTVAVQPPPAPLRTWYPPRPSRESAASDADSPTLGLDDKVQFRTISQVSAEKPPSSLEEAAQGQSNLDTVARLTVHQNQMESFGASFPPDFVMPAVPTIPAEYQQSNGVPNGAKAPVERDTRTPTQADYNARSDAAGSSAQGAQDGAPRSGPHVFPPRTVSRKPPQVDLRGLGLNLPGERIQNSKLAPGKGPNGALTNSEVRPFSFIQFDDVQSEQFAIQTPITPKASNFELNKMHGHGLRPGRPGPVEQSEDLNAEETPLEPSKIRPSGRRKPSSSSRSRDHSAASLHRKGSEAETGIRDVANKTHPFQRPYGKKASRSSLDQRPSIDESPELSPAPTTRAGTSPMHHQESPAGNRRQRHHSLLKGLGIKTSPQSFRPQLRAHLKLDETGEPPPRAPLEPKDGNQSVLGPTKTRNVADHARSVSANMLNHSASMGQQQDKGKKRRFSSLGSFFMKPSPRKTSLAKSNLGPPPQEGQVAESRDQAAPGPPAAASAFQRQFQNHAPPSSHRSGPSPGYSPEPPSGVRTDSGPPAATASHATPRTTTAQPAQPHIGTPDPASTVPHPGADAKPHTLVNVHPAFRPDTGSSTAAAKHELYSDDHPPPPPPKDEKHRRSPSVGAAGHQRQPSGGASTHQRQPSGGAATHRRQASASSPQRAKTQPTTPSPQRERRHSLLSAFPTPPSAAAGHSPTRAAGPEPAGEAMNGEKAAEAGSPERRRQHHRSLPPLNAIGKSKPPAARPLAAHAEAATPVDQDKKSEGLPPRADGALTTNGTHVASPAAERAAAPPTPAARAEDKAETDTLKESVRAPPPDDDEEIVMSSTSYPGQEWQPTIGAWEGD